MSVAATAVRSAEGGVVSRRAIWLALAAILLLEVALFGWSFGQFFCGDSLYYFATRVKTPAEAVRVLTQQDRLHSYRPLPYLVFSFLLYPLFGLEPLGYHLVTLAAHLLISLLVFLLLRDLVSKRAAALAGTLFFGVHAVNIYITYDVSFLPDFGSGLFYVAALLGYARFARGGSRLWLPAALGSFVLAVLFKESAVVLPVGVLAVDLLLRRGTEATPAQPERPWWQPRPAAFAFVALAGLYLAWTFHLKGGIYPRGPREPYSLTLDPAALKLKLRYLVWFANLPAQPVRHGWPAYAAMIAMLPALLWIAGRAARVVGRLWRELALCALWALAGLLPVLFINQVPMKHNLYMPVLACAVGLALLVKDTHPDAARLWPRGWAWLAAGMVAATAFQVPGDLRNSWVGEASHIARASLDAMRREHPTLPRGALLFVLPTSVRGMASWYFQDGVLFKLFYNDPSLRMDFADQGAHLPADFASRPEVLLFHFHDHRLWDVSREYKRDAVDRQSYRLLEQVPRARIETRFRWEASDLPDSVDAITVRPMARNGQSRLALVAVAGTTASFDLPPIPPQSVLQVGLTVAGPLKSGARGRILFQDARGSELLLVATLDAANDAQNWWDREVDLAPLAERQGTLVLETAADHDADWLVWSRLRIIQRTNSFYAEISREVDQPLPPRTYRLLDRFEAAQVSFDRSEVYPDYSRFDTPDGKPAFLHAARRGDPGYFTMVTIAGASVKFPLALVPPDSALEVTAINLGKLGDGVRGRVFVEDASGREKIFDELLPPRSNTWVKRMLSLEKWQGSNVTLVLEGSSGPRRETIADWCAWGRLRIITNAKP